MPGRDERDEREVEREERKPKNSLIVGGWPGDPQIRLPFLLPHDVAKGQHAS